LAGSQKMSEFVNEDSETQGKEGNKQKSNVVEHGHD
jgi:hypothetical protein